MKYFTLLHVLALSLDHPLCRCLEQNNPHGMRSGKNGAWWIFGNLSSPRTAKDVVEEARKHHALKGSKYKRSDWIQPTSKLLDWLRSSLSIEKGDQWMIDGFSCF
ncbi:hypothetical protein POM88_047454 [Heracleum sosnowskyi]|uniref:Uncharacterized protein n=1 Tax=Heracleum sosnowskyi TaxID=360622 RepID=A0AAD8LZI8_9APIA|nr:hypothetical protein POM88_047454 [Heracleum sosnowskyi]